MNRTRLRMQSRAPRRQPTAKTLLGEVAEPDPGLRPQIARALARARVGEDLPWLAVMAAVTVAEFLWWAVEWIVGAAPLPFVWTYLAVSIVGLVCALGLRGLLFRRWVAPNWPVVTAAVIMIGLGASLFLPIKYAIPRVVPFWLDQPLAGAERSLFGADPWLLLEWLLGWAAVPIDWLYATWLPTQSLVLFCVVLAPPSREKTHALIAYVLGWFALGIVAALALSSAGPLFDHRIFGGTDFAGLREVLHRRGAMLALAESDAMWASLESGRPTLVAGISAMPSIHVAISAWMALAAGVMARRAAPWAIAYTALIWIGSVQLGWHYFSDGLAGVLGIIAVWLFAGLVRRRT